MDRILLTLFTFIALGLYGVMFTFAPAVKRFQVQAEGQVSFGPESAVVNVIIFEEFACLQCKRFHNEVMDDLFSNYVDTGKIRVTIIPVAYLDPSYPAFSAACCIGKLGPRYLKAFLDHFFDMSDNETDIFSAKELATSFVARNPKLPLNEILQCTESEAIEDLREKSITSASNLYDESIHMPTVLVNGKLVFPLDRQAVFSTIEKELYDKKK